MRLHNILLHLACWGAAAASLTACDEQREFFIYEGDIPIKTTTLYMMGDATPSGWSIDNPTELTRDADNGYIFTYEGFLNTGELKLLTSKGDWGVAFIRPIVDATEIGDTDITDDRFQMSLESETGDLKWKVVKAGEYRLSFNLHDWTMSASYVVRDLNAPIEAETVYMMGDATPSGWSIDEPEALVRDAANGYIFTWEGYMPAGELKFFTEKGNWLQPFIRPVDDGQEIGRAGLPETKFLYALESEAGDLKWKITDRGIYRFTLDLEHHTIKAEYQEGEGYVLAKATTMYLLGTATAAAWDMAAAEAMTRDEQTPSLFRWKGFLTQGELKFMTVTSDWGQPFVRPLTDKEPVGTADIVDAHFAFTPDSEGDNKWFVVAEGVYDIAIDVVKETITIKSDKHVTDIIDASTLYMMGDATPGRWSIDNGTPLERSSANPYVFEWEGYLATGQLKFFVTPGLWAQPFIRPLADLSPITRAGIVNEAFQYTTEQESGDLKWEVKDDGVYRLRLDLAQKTISAEWSDRDPYVLAEATEMYLYGTATPTGWDIVNPLAMERSADNGHIFVWTGPLTRGELKFMTSRGNYGQPFVRPLADKEPLGGDTAVENQTFQYTPDTEGDNKWNVVADGTYTISIDAVAMTISVSAAQ